MTRRTFVVLLAVVVVPIVALVVSSALGAGSFEADGRDAYASGDWQSAAEYLEIAHDRAPDDHEVAYLLAGAYGHLNDESRARDLYFALRDVPAWRDRAISRLSLLSADRGRFDEAAAEIDRALAETPRSPYLVEARGLVRRRQARVALDAFRKTLTRQVRSTTAASLPDRMYELRGVPEAEYVKRVNAILDRLAVEDAFEDREGFLAAFAAVREATALMEEDFVAATKLGPATTHADSELLALRIERDDLKGARAAFDRSLAAARDATLDRESRATARGGFFRGLDLLSRAYEAAKKPAEALKILEIETPHIPPEKAAPKPSIELRERLARLYLAEGRDADAERVAVELIAFKTRNATGNFVLAKLAERRGDDKSAAVRFQTAYDSKPDDPVFAGELGRSLLRRGKPAQAIAVLNRALEKRPRDPEFNLAATEAVLLQEGKEAAAKYLEGRIQGAFRSGGDPADVARLQDRLDALWKDSGETVTTLAEAFAALDESPTNTRRVLNVVRLLLSERNDGAGALERVNELLARAPKLADGWKLKAAALERLGRRDEALDAAREARRLDPTDVVNHWREARLLLAAGSFASARDAARRGLEVDARHPELRLLAAEADVAQGKVAEALVVLNDLAGDHPNDPALLRLRGRALVMSDKAAEALEPLRKADAALPGDSETRRWLGEALIKSGRSREMTEGAGMLRGVADDAAAAFKTRRAAADVLLKADYVDDAAAAYAKLLPATTSGAERLEVQTRILQTRAASTKPWEALDAAEAMVRDGAGESSVALAALVNLLLKAKFVAEAAEAADHARAQGVGGPEFLEAAYAAHVAAEAWAKAADDLEALRMAAKLAEGDLAARRATTFFGLRRFADADAAAGEALKTLKGSERVQPLVVRLRLAATTGDGDRVLATFGEIQSVASGSLLSAARDVAIDGLLAAGRLADAGTLLAATGPGSSSRVDAATLTAAIRFATDDPAGALAALDAAKPSAAVASARGLLAAFARKDEAPAGTFGAWCAKLALRDFEGAAKAARAVAGEPESIRGLLRRIAAAASAKPDDAGLLAQDLAGARLLFEGGLGADRWQAPLRRAAERETTLAADLDVLRASLLLARRNPKAAADVVVPLLETRGADAAVLYVAGAAAAANGGGAGAERFLDSLASPAPPETRKDLAALLAAYGELASADAVLAKIERPDDDVRVDRLRIAVKRRNLRDAAAAVAGIAAGRLRAGTDEQASAWWVALQDPQTKAAAAAELSLLLADAKRSERVDATLLLECAALGASDEDMGRAIDGALRRARFSATALEEAADVLRRRPRDVDALGRLETYLRWLDPARRLRTAARPTLALR